MSNLSKATKAVLVYWGDEWIRATEWHEHRQKGSITARVTDRRGKNILFKFTHKNWKAA